MTSPTPHARRLVRERQDLHTVSDIDRRMNDLSARELYEQILLGCIRGGLDPNAPEETKQFGEYIAPVFDPIAAARVAAEASAHFSEVIRTREHIIRTLRATPAHQKLSAFDRLLLETEYWTGVREWGDSSNNNYNNSNGMRGARGHAGKRRDTGEGTDSAGDEMLHITETPSYIRGTLRPYQIEGVNWLLGLHSRCINGILADEMGLGKTLQTIATMAYLKFTHGLPGPHLVVCPKSVMGNWFRELKHWCPALTVYKFHAAGDIRPQVIRAHLNHNEGIKYDVVVTTFEMVLEELNTFRRISWQYLIVDEAHKLKNEESRAHLALDSLNTHYRLIITGTPLQNNLKELWALLHFLAPRLFDDAESFEAWFNTTSGQEDDNAMGNMHKILAPLMIRRLKADVNTGIPPKKEIYVSCKLSKLQRKWYMHVLARDAESLNKVSGGSLASLSNILVHLRKVINHPYLMEGGEEGPPFITDERIVRHSGKMVILDKLLHRLRGDKAEKHKVLIFSQFTTMLDILEDYCTLRGFHICRIDGNTSGYDRDAQMAAFNSPTSDCFIFLLSTRAGGLGINLQAANHVVLYDSDWNPQMDLQAQDRAHRIGQRRVVRVYRFVTDGTVEEKIYRRALKKLYLDAMVVQNGRIGGGPQSSKHVSKEEMLSMIKFGAEELFKARDEDITEADIDRLLDEGESKSNQLSSAAREQIQMSLASFKLGAEEANVYDFEGVSYKTGVESRMLHITLSAPVAQDEIHKQCSEFGDVLRVVLHPNLTEALAFFRTTSGAIEAKENLPYECHFASRDAQKMVVPTEMITEYLGSAGEKLGRGHRQREPITPRVYSQSDVEKMQSHAQRAPPLRLPKAPKFPPHQLFNTRRLEELHHTEVALMVRNWKRRHAPQTEKEKEKEKDKKALHNKDDNEEKEQKEQKEEEAREGEGEGEGEEEEEETLTAVEQEERERLLSEGFANWSHAEYRRLTAALTSGACSLTDYAALAAAIGGDSGKTIGEVRDYTVALMERGAQCIKSFGLLEQRIERAQRRKRAREDLLRAAQWKVESCERPETQLTFRGRATANDMDRRIFLMAYDAGFQQMNMGEVVRGLPENRFDVWCQSRSAAFFERRLHGLMMSVKREWEKPNGDATELSLKRRRTEVME